MNPPATSNVPLDSKRELVNSKRPLLEDSLLVSMKDNESYMSFQVDNHITKRFHAIPVQTLIALASPSLPCPESLEARDMRPS